MLLGDVAALRFGLDPLHGGVREQVLREKPLCSRAVALPAPGRQQVDTDVPALAVRPVVDASPLPTRARIRPGSGNPNQEKSSRPSRVPIASSSASASVRVSGRSEVTR